MAQFLILRLDGPMQAWGTHTFEDFRLANLFPTRGGLLGLIGACLRIGRGDRERLDLLAESVQLTLRVDNAAVRIEVRDVPIHSQKRQFGTRRVFVHTAAAVVLSIEDYGELARRKETLLEFFQRSPLRGVDLDITQDQDFGRDVDL